jgi:gas vesicle protein
MKYSFLLCSLLGAAAGVLLAPEAGPWNRYLTRKTKECQKLINSSFRRTEKTVADAADGIIDALETGRKRLAT